MSLVGVARRVRERRQALDLTLEQVAGRTGLTRSVLSKVENFRVTPSLPALAKIAQALDTTISELTRGVDETPEVSIVRNGEGVQVERDRPDSRIAYESLTFKCAGMMESLLLSLPSGTAREEAMSHEGEEFLYVMEGQVAFEYGEETFELNQGDSAYFNANIPHRVNNKNSEVAKIMSVFASDKKSGYCPKCASRIFFLASDPQDSGDTIYHMIDQAHDNECDGKSPVSPSVTVEGA